MTAVYKHSVRNMAIELYSTKDLKLVRTIFGYTQKRRLIVCVINSQSSPEVCSRKN